MRITMNEYCISFLDTSGEEPAEVFHCHVHAPADLMAMEVALRMSAEDNIQVSAATVMRIQVVLPLPADLMQALELVRAATHGATPTPNPMAPASHLH